MPGTSTVRPGSSAVVASSNTGVWDFRRRSVTKQREPSGGGWSALVCIGIAIVVVPIILRVVGVVIAAATTAIFVLAIAVLIGSICGRDRD